MLIKKSQSELQTQIQTLNNELLACKNIEKQHQRCNGMLHKEIDKLKKEIFDLKKENDMHKENLQAELIRSMKKWSGVC